MSYVLSKDYQILAIFESKGDDMSNKVGKKITDEDHIAAFTLKTVRTNLGFSQEEMAELCGCSLSQYRRYEGLKCPVPANLFIRLVKKQYANSHFLLTGETEPALVGLIEFISCATIKDMTSAAYHGYAFLQHKTEIKNKIEERHKRKKK